MRFSALALVLVPGVAFAQARPAAPAAAPAAATAPPEPAGPCVDPVEKARLLEAKRGRRSDLSQFTKINRHELTLQGGYYVSDLLDGTFVIGAAYTYHLTEDAGIEASFGYSQNKSSVAARLERDRGVTVLPKDDRVFLVFTDLIWAPVHGKMSVFSGSIVHFDIYGAVGVGVIDNSTSFGAAGQFGVGIKALLGRSWGVRLDVRDHLYRQQILAVNQYVQDFSLTLGASVFLPMGL